MDLSEKLLQARLEAGLSQRQLCGDTITRNMLSRIEHGVARPSMKTLQYLAQRLEKPVSYFLEEEAAVSPNQELMAKALASRSRGKLSEARQLLQGFRLPDPVLEWQWHYLSAVTALEAAQEALAQQRQPYARQLLEEAGAFTGPFPGLERRRLLLLGQVPGCDLAVLVLQLPSLDQELLLRAQAALAAREPQRAAALLEAAEDRQSPQWHLLRGQTFLLLKEYPQAVQCLRLAESACPDRCWPLLEECFRELGDFQNAYLYACKQR